jgi:HK97 family phage portal protein
LPALYAGARLLSDSAASLPLRLYMRSNPHAHAQRYTGPSIFDKPSVSGTIFDWIFTAMSSLVLQGNAWGFITGRDGYGYPTGIEWIPPDDVDCVDDEMQPWNPLRTRIYVYGRLMSRDELFHIKAFSLAGRTEGISPLRAFALTIASGIEAARYGTDWYQSGGFPPGTFQNNEIEIDADQAEQIRSMLVTVMRRREPLVYGRDWDYKPVVVPPSEAQFVQAIQMNAGQIAAILGLPADRIGGTKGDSLTYTNAEQSTLQVIEALRPWLVRLETAFFDLLPANRYARFNADALLKTDLKTRTDIYVAQRNIGLRTVDELRDQEDLEPLGGGNGGESIPLEVMVAMARTIRAIPKSMLSGIVLEMDLIAAKLQELAQQGLAPEQPTAPPAKNAEAMLGQMLTTRALAGSLSQLIAGGGLDDNGDATKIMNYLAAHRTAPRNTDGPEYVGAWIPSPRETVLSGVNGNGYPHVNGHDGHSWDGGGYG